MRYLSMASPSPINLAFFTDSLEPSGVGEVISLLSRTLPADRYRQILICPDTPAVNPLVERCPSAAVVRRLTVRDDGHINQFAELVAFLQAENVDVFHNHIGATWEGDWGTLAAQMAGVPVVVTTEHLPCILERPSEIAFKRRINCLAHRVITVSDSVRRTHVRAGIAAGDQVVTIRNGIDFDRFHNLELPEAATKLRRVPADVLIGTVGRMTPQKGHKYLLKAIPAVLARYPGARFVWIGDGSERDSLKAEARRLDIMANVWFMGWQPEAWRWLPAFDFTVLPSLFEGLPLAALESLAAGRAVVGARACGTVDAIRDGETGLLVEPQNPAALATAILRLLDRPEERERMGACGRSRVEAEFSVQRMAREHDELYCGLLAGKGPMKEEKDGSDTPGPGGYPGARIDQRSRAPGDGRSDGAVARLQRRFPAAPRSRTVPL
jgi:glycosyltransferase involved in cell wall biosynthesis